LVKSYYDNGFPWMETLYAADGTCESTHYYYPSGSQWFTINYLSDKAKMPPIMFSEIVVTVEAVKKPAKVSKP
ncbi:MAG: hypothetical protein PHN49_07765, partial [Candidatus Omnitrophica bacterium]|nr:hypothetical protein [Candidatus Omnitrophota bacterium]